MEAETVRVLVAIIPEPIKGPQALPDISNLLKDRLTTKAIDISVESLKYGIMQVVSKMLPILDELPETGNYEVASVDLNLAIDSQGQLAIVGAVTAGVQISSGITVTISKKPKTP